MSNTSENADRFEVRATSDSHFGWIRTRLSVERTMMSWLRTSVSLIAFGFAIVQFFERLQKIPGDQPGVFPTAPKYLGLSLIFCGVFALVISIWQYRFINRYLRSGRFAQIAGLGEDNMQSPVIAVAALLALIGLLAASAVLTRLV